MYMDEKVKLSFVKLGLRIKNLREDRTLNIKEFSKLTGIRKKHLEIPKSSKILLNKP